MLFALGLFNCNIDAIVFAVWVTDFLFPSLTKPKVIIMDNPVFDNNQAILHSIKAAGHIVEFLPTYSPNKNPIEHK